jgi:hypothetical protein
LLSCKSDNVTESDNDDQGGSIRFSANCAIPPAEHPFTMAKAGEVTASFVSLQPATGTGAAITLIASNGTRAVGAPGQKVTATFPAGQHKLVIGHNHIEPSCSYTVQVDFPK